MWTLQLPEAHLECGSHANRIKASLELQRPHHGLQKLACNAQTFAGRPMQLCLPGRQAELIEPVEDAYVRDSDLIVTYGAALHRDVTPQIYWRALEAGEGVMLALELWVSMQTSLLASHPTTRIVSQFPGKDIWGGVDSPAHETAHPPSPRFEPLEVGTSRADQYQLLLYRDDQFPWSWLEMIYPADCAGTQVRREGTSGSEWEFEMFPASLEKGVIRRARIRGYLLAREDDERRAGALWQDFCQAAPPLTA